MRSACQPQVRLLSALLLGLMATAGCAAPRASVHTVTAQAPQLLASSAGWSTISLPVSGNQLRSWMVMPADPATLFACSGEAYDFRSGASEGPITLWRTRDTGYHWSQLALPANSGTSCALAVAPDNPQRIAFVVTDYNEQRACDRLTIYLSEDAGDTWTHVAHTSIAPAGTGASAQCLVLVSARYLYVWYSYGGGVGGGPEVALLERGEAHGAWTRIDTQFGADALYIPWQLGDGDSLMASVLHLAAVHDPKIANSPELWITHDAGHSWQDVGGLPEGVGSFVWAAPGRTVTGPTPTAPWYALTNEQISSNLYRLQVVQSVDGRRWTALPPLPIAGASPERMGLLQALGVMPDGRLLAWGPDPSVGVPAPDVAQSQSTPSFWLWLWNPRTARWQTLAAPLNHPAGEGCGLCWDGQLSSGLDHATYLTVNAWEGNAGPFRVRLPDAA
jgi:hypothetical protein